ncbi:MAG: hypothetical protein R2710_27830 [Acidimicrobiales bacterium]
MSSTFKRLLAMMFAFTLLAAACGSDSGGSDTEAGSEGATETTAADDSGEDSGSDAGASGEGDCASEEVLCVGLVTDVGKIDDKSFNQSAWEGVQASVADVYDFIRTRIPRTTPPTSARSSIRTTTSS